MTDPTIHSGTRLLADWKAGSDAALEQLTPLVYRELPRLADSYLRRERATAVLAGGDSITPNPNRLSFQNSFSAMSNVYGFSRIREMKGY